MNGALTNDESRLDRLMNLREVAKWTGRSVRQLWREIADKKLAQPVPGRPARLFESDVQKYLKRLRDERDKNLGAEQKPSPEEDQLDSKERN